MTTHHKYSPSALELLERCPRYVPDDKDSEAAKRGQRMHTATELGNPDMLEDQHDRDMVITALMHTQQLQAMLPNGVVKKEMRLESDINHGTGDFVIIDFESATAAIQDHKFGAVAVEPVDRNIQLYNYGYNLMYQYPEIQKVILAISQPEVNDTLGITEITREMIPAIVTRINRIIERVESGAPETPDGKACEHCQNKATCRYWADVASQQLQFQYGIEIATNVLLGIDYDDPETIAKVQLTAAMLEDWGKQVKKATAQRVKDLGITVPGYTLVSRPGNLGVESAEQLLALLGEQQIDLVAFVLRCCNISATQTLEMLYDIRNVDIDELRAELLKSGTFKRGADITYLKKSTAGKKKTKKALDSSAVVEV